MSLFSLPGSEHGVDAAFVTPVCPRLVFGNAVPAHLVKYCTQPLRDRIDPHEDEQELRLSSASIKFLM